MGIAIQLNAAKKLDLYVFLGAKPARKLAETNQNSSKPFHRFLRRRRQRLGALTTADATAPHSNQNKQKRKKISRQNWPRVAARFATYSGSGINFPSENHFSDGFGNGKFPVFRFFFRIFRSENDLKFKFRFSIFSDRMFSDRKMLLVIESCKISEEKLKILQHFI